MDGHVFILQGDLRRIAADAWLLPSSQDLEVTPSWWEGASDAARARVGADGRLDLAVPDDWGPGGRRVLRVPDWWEGDAPTTWLANVTGPADAPVDWYLDAVDQFVAAATGEEAVRPAHARREHRLLALPLVGTGGGGAARRRGEMVRALLERLDAHARRHGVDIALVTGHDRDFAAAQWARRHRLASGTEPTRVWRELTPAMIDQARELASEAASGKLVLFLGAGVSASAGLPLWRELLSRLAEDAGFDDDEQASLGRLPFLDQARLIEKRLRDAGSELTGQVLEQLSSPRYGLSHGLLACLPIDQVVTTNYDRLFEDASEAAGSSVAVLPAEPTPEHARWLLKLHGSVDEPDDIVMTRQDVLRYAERRAALAGIVQSLLITQRMLFVGFSLSDENFHRIADDVRRALGGRSAPGQAFGTALLLRRDPLLGELWEGDVAFVAMADGDQPEPAAARRLEIFLDCLLTHASDDCGHLLDPDFDRLLDDDERELKAALLRLREVAEGRRAAIWGPVHQLLRRYGDERPGASSATIAADDVAPREKP
jgi:hypothetical protein